MLLVLRIRDRFQEIRIAARSADVIGRTGIRAGQAEKWALIDTECTGPLDEYLMFPSVAEVVEIEKARDRRLQDLAKHGTLLGDDGPLLLEVRIRHAVAHGPDSELMHVRIAPSHDDLEDLVEFR